MRRAPALIVGGGPAGSAAAVTLARAGLRATVLERTREPADALCGGFLSWRTLEQLAALGVAADALNPRPVTRVRMFAGERVAESRLPAPGRAVSRRRLDALLLARAAAEGAAVERGVAARAFEGATVRLDDGALLAADAVLLATGKHDVRGLARPAAARGADPTLGLRVRLPASPALDRLVGDAVELHLFDRGYAGLAVQEDGSVNCCMAVHRSRLHEAGSPERLFEVLAAGPLGDRLGTRDGAPIEAVANVPYGWRCRDGVPGLFRLGDQAGVIPSLAGEGMGIALASGAAAARALLAGGAVASAGWQRRFARRLARPIATASAAWHLAEGRHRRTLVGLAAACPPLLGLLARATRIAPESIDATAIGADPG